MPDSNRVIFENDACLVINKLPGEASECSGLVDAAAEEPKAGVAQELFPVHRLDTPVSGCLLLARTREAAAFLSAAFSAQGRVKKRYWAIVEKPAAAEERFLQTGEASIELVHWLSENKKLNKSFAARDAAGQGAGDHIAGDCRASGQRKKNHNSKPKKAILRYRLAGQGDNYLFLEIDLVTGRHHQIRAQLAAEGLHVKGDLKYGARRSEKGGGIRLHAFSLAFPNPLNRGETIRISAPPPLMDTLWQAFQSNTGIL